MGSFAECQDLFTPAATLLCAPDEDQYAATVSFLAEAEQLLGPLSPLPSLDEALAFLAQAESGLLEHWRRRIGLLREADPRKRPDFQTINLLDVFGIGRQEIPHSRFLAWLLDPRENHGLGTAFLDAFLRLAQKTCGHEFDADLDAVEVSRERSTDKGVPDITVIGTDFLCVVENKVLAAEGLDQTQRYADAAESEASQEGIPPDHLLLVFLSPRGSRPKDCRFHALAYPPLLQLLEGLLSRPVSPIVDMAIRQFVFNLRAGVLRQYKHATAVINHLEEHAKRGDDYLSRHWREIESLIRTLQEVNGMPGFEGFSPISLLYAEKYDLVRAMMQAFRSEREQLFVEVQNRIVEAPWYDPARITVQVRENMEYEPWGEKYLEMKLQEPASEMALAHIQIWLGVYRFPRRKFYSGLYLLAKVPDVGVFGRRFQQVAAQKLSDAPNIDYSPSSDDRFLIRRRNIPFEPDTVLNAIIDEIERLQRFFPYVEQVYLELTSGEEEQGAE
jgi:hypothetical protein